jgi:hypothetical protein
MTDTVDFGDVGERSRLSPISRPIIKPAAKKRGFSRLSIIERGDHAYASTRLAARAPGFSGSKWLQDASSSEQLQVVGW